MAERVSRSIASAPMLPEAAMAVSASAAAPRVMPLIFAMDAAMALNLSVVMPEMLPVRIKFFLNSSISVDPA
jgi:hypothetical protein